MNNLEVKNMKFKNSVDDVLSFMQLITKITVEASTATDFGLYQKVIRSQVPYNAMIISLYGSMELFVDEIADSYLQALFELSDSYDELPAKVREKQETNAGEYLTNPQRFVNYSLSGKDIAMCLYSCLQENKTDHVEKKLLLRHSGNLRSDQVFNFFQGIGVDNAMHKIINNSIFVEAYANTKGIDRETAKARLGTFKNGDPAFMSLFLELDDLVEQRNQVAHSGRVDEKRTFEYIEEKTIPFLLTLTDTIANVLSNELVKKSVEKGRIEEFACVYDVVNNRIILADRGTVELRIGDVIGYECNGNYGCTIVKNIRANSIDVSQVTDVDERNISFEVDKAVKANWKLFKLE